MRFDLLSTVNSPKTIWLANCRLESSTSRGLAGQILSYGFAFFDKKFADLEVKVENEQISLLIEIPTYYINSQTPIIAINGQLKVIHHEINFK